MSSGQYYIEDGYIYGPKMPGQFYIQDGYIYGPKSGGQYYIDDGYIYGPKRSGMFYVDGGYIYEPDEEPPWLPIVTKRNPTVTARRLRRPGSLHSLTSGVCDYQ